MLRSIALFELRYLLRAPQAWFMFLVFFALGTLAFGYISGEGASDIFGLGRNVRVNAPFYLAAALAVLSLLAIFAAPQFVGEAIIKDRDCRFDSIVFTTQVSKFDYLYGRFLGGFGALLVAFLGAPLGMMLSPAWTFTFPEGSLAPFDLTQYILVMVVYTLPSLLLCCSMVFVVAVVARSLIYTHLLNLAVLVLLVVALLLTARLRLEFAQSLPFLNPLLALLSALPTYWSVEQLNGSLLSADPWGSALLLNRLCVTLLAVVLLALAYPLFSFTRHARVRHRPRKAGAARGAAPAKVASAAALQAQEPATRRAPVWSPTTALHQFLRRTGFEFRSVFWSLPFLLLMLIDVGLMLDRLGYAAELSFPETYILANVLGAGELGVFLIIAVLIFSPEIFWREHQHQAHEVMHALPIPNWVFVGSKLLALMGILVAVVLMNIALALYFQFRDDTSIDLALYLQRSLLFLLVPYCCFAVLVSLLQVVASNRFTGSALAVLLLLVTAALYAFGFQHPLYQNVLLADNAPPLSGMDSDGSYQAKGYWLRAYWIGISGVAVLLIFALCNRGILQPLRLRLQQLQRFRRLGYFLPAVACSALAVGAGGFIFYNTNVLNRYFDPGEREAQSAQYEQLYRQYEDLPMPRITDIDMELALFPPQRRLEFKAALVLTNKSEQPIESVHLELPFGIEFDTLELAGATLSSADALHRYQRYTLATPMQPGEQRVLSINAHKQLRGFRASEQDTTLVDNGSYFEIATLIPHIGFSQGRLLQDAATRAQYGLAPLQFVGRLDEDPATSRFFNNSAQRADADLVNFAATLSTVAGQTAVTVGRLTEQWQQDERAYFRYRSDLPIHPVIPFFSARYAVLRDSWRPADGAAEDGDGQVDIEIYYHPQHAYHLDVMLQGLKDGLTAFSAAYGPYQYRQLRVLEYPGYRSNSRSLPTTIAHSEANGFVIRDPAETYESMAHELAHHWWGHQIMGARVEGTGMLGEGLASYSARMLMEQKYGEEFHLHRIFVSPNRRYLRGRNSDPVGEVPLYRAAGQSYLDYSKSESILYALQDQLGQDVLDTALREFVATYRNRVRPYVVATDFLAILKRTAGAEHAALIEDMFEKITLYEFSLRAANAELLDDGRYRITLEIGTGKLYGDASGNDVPAGFDGQVRVGLFAKRPQDRRFRVDTDVIQLDLRAPPNGVSTVEFIVDRLPLFAGINPYEVLIERDMTDNVRPVTVVSMAVE